MAIYLDPNYSNYKYLVEVHDNYLVLSNSRSVDGTWEFPDTINVVYQYLEPSYLSIPSRLSFSSSRSFSEVSTSSDYWTRSDSLEIFMCGFYILLIILFIVNGLGRLFRRGGAFAR